MAFKIYTKTGDSGNTSLFGGMRVPKDHIRIESYGTIDELNSFLGLLRDHLLNEKDRGLLKEIQDRLFTIGANLAAQPDKNMPIPDILDKDVQLLEEAIDEMNLLLPPLKSFILPGGHKAVSMCHVCRCLCRRAERNVVALHHNEPVLPILLTYLNRLSDYFFVLGRKVANDLNIDEIQWKPRQ